MTADDWADRFDRPQVVALEPLPATTWAEIDIGPTVDGLLDGNLERPTPVVGRRTDGVALFYAGRVNAIFGESGDGKSWLALTVAAQEIADGHAAVWCDFEDDDLGVIGRLLDLGADPDQIKARFHYLSPSEPFSAEAETEIRALVTGCEPTIVVIDSQGESMSVDGVRNSNDDAEVARWMRRVPRFVADLGPAVLVIDHVPKATGAGKLFAIGSQRKRAAISGLAVLVEVITEFGIGHAGRSKLTCAKDRCGSHIRGQRTAEYTLDATGDGCVGTIEVPTSSTDQDGRFRPTGLMESVSRWLEVNPDATKNAITGSVRGKREWVLVAIDTLISDGNITTTPGPNRAIHHRVIKPFRDTEGTPE